MISKVDSVIKTCENRGEVVDIHRKRVGNLSEPVVQLILHVVVSSVLNVSGSCHESVIRGMIGHKRG